MKKMKRMIALLCVLLMSFAPAMPVSAEDETYSVTIDNATAGHIYEAYQIFSGDYANGVLSNVRWGAGVNGDTLLAALKADSTIDNMFTKAATAADVAKVMDGIAADSEQAQVFAAVAGANLAEAQGTSTFADSRYVIQGLAAGYYLVKDQDETMTGQQDAYTRFIVQVAGDVTAAPKSDVPAVEKKVQENVKYPEDGGYGASYNDVADWNIGDAVPFQLIGTMPGTLGDYGTYKYVFHDTMSAGLTYNGDAKVYLVNGATRTEVTEGFEVSADGQNLTVSFGNVKSIEGLTAASQIVVEYTATLNADAVIGLDGNENKVYLEFSNDPNQSGESAPTGRTPEDQVIVFTYELDVTKVDGKDGEKLLSGAKFKLQNADRKWVSVDTSGKVIGWVDEETNGSVLTSDANGLFKVIGLDDGIYRLKEIKAPSGYNLLEEPVTLIIRAATTNNQTWAGIPDTALTALTIQVDSAAAMSGDTATGIAGATVQNNRGAMLPATGGIGTKIFYVAGAILMIGAGVLLINRKRTKK